MASTHKTTDSLASRRAFWSVQLWKKKKNIKTASNSFKQLQMLKNTSVFLPSHLRSQNIKQMEAEAV